MSRTALIKAKPSASTRVNNGKELFFGVDARTYRARRYRDLLYQMLEARKDPIVSSRQMMLARRAAAVALQLELQEGEVVAGNAAPDLTSYTAASNLLLRLLAEADLN